MKFIKKNWLLLVLGLLVIVLLCERGCKKSTYKEDIKASDKKIESLEADNRELEDVVKTATENARVLEERVAEKEAAIAESEIVIKRLKKERIEVSIGVMELPPSELVEETREILGCAEIELREDGILYSIECAQKSLIIIKKFSLIKEELDETYFALSESQEATRRQKIATWSVYRIAWAQGSQIIGYRSIVKEKDYQFSLCQKKKKGAWWDGLWKGFVIGVIVTATAKLIFGKLI